MVKIFNPATYAHLTPDYYQKEMPVLVLMNGGTADGKSYQRTKRYKEFGEPPRDITPLKRSRVPSVLKSNANRHFCSYFQMQMEDSKKFIKDRLADEEITEAEREEARRLRGAVKEMILSCDQTHIVITFGTDAMADMARILAEELAGIGKVIMLTGAMEPISHGEVSDAPKTINFAVDSCLNKKLEPGVYVAMPNEQGERQIFHADDTLGKVVVDGGNGRKKRYFTGNAVELETITPVLLSK